MDIEKSHLKRKRNETRTPDDTQKKRARTGPYQRGTVATPKPFHPQVSRRRYKANRVTLPNQGYGRPIGPQIRAQSMQVHLPEVEIPFATDKATAMQQASSIFHDEHDTAHEVQDAYAAGLKFSQAPAGKIGPPDFRGQRDFQAKMHLSRLALNFLNQQYEQERAEGGEGSPRKIDKPVEVQSNWNPDAPESGLYISANKQWSRDRLPAFFEQLPQQLHALEAASLEKRLKSGKLKTAREHEDALFVNNYSLVHDALRARLAKEQGRTSRQPTDSLENLEHSEGFMYQALLGNVKVVNPSDKGNHHAEQLVRLGMIQDEVTTDALEGGSKWRCFACSSRLGVAHTHRGVPFSGNLLPKQMGQEDARRLLHNDSNLTNTGSANIGRPTKMDFYVSTSSNKGRGE